MLKICINHNTKIKLNTTFIKLVMTYRGMMWIKFATFLYRRKNNMRAQTIKNEE